MNKDQYTSIANKFSKLSILNAKFHISNYVKSRFIEILKCDLDKASTNLIFIAVILFTCYAIGGK